MQVYIDAVGIMGPGLTGWKDNVDKLRNSTHYEFIEMQDQNTSLLPANERRRTTHNIKLALAAAEDAVSQNKTDRKQLATVFASSEGDTEIVDKICTSLTYPGRPVSPTHFHNSVHNAPAGYWAIATGSRMTSTSLSAHHASFSAGLVEAMVMIANDPAPVLLVAYDYPPPDPLLAVCPMNTPFSVALLLNREASDHCIAKCKVEITPGDNYSRIDNDQLESIRLGNPAARSLPLLIMLAEKNNGSVFLPYLPGSLLNIEIEQC